jgi:hypothetical protein
MLHRTFYPFKPNRRFDSDCTLLWKCLKQVHDVESVFKPACLHVLEHPWCLSSVRIISNAIDCSGLGYPQMQAVLALQSGAWGLLLMCLHLPLNDLESWAAGDLHG